MRGHRVSNCQHSDRPLQHINKKGRPVSQCTHCRTLRKSRSAHVRCDCGGERAHTKGACTQDGDSQAENCCCSHGARCSCALKKEHLDPVPESDSDDSPASTVTSNDKRRPRASTAQSETSLTVFTNGHHKPVHKHNNMAHKCGLPYVVPRAHSIQGLSPTSLANRSVDSLPQTNSIEALHSESQIKDSMVSAQQEQRKVKSENGSPVINPATSLDILNGQLPPLDLSNLSGSYNYSQQLDGFSAPSDQEQPLFSAGLSSASIDWSHYDGLDFNNDNFATSSYSQAPSFTGFDFSSIDQPALTATSTSGEISEVEDFVPAGNQQSGLSNQYGSEFDASDFGGEIDGYRLSNTSSYIGMPQTQMLTGNTIEGLDMDAFLKGVANGYSRSSDGLPNLPNYAEDGKIGQMPSLYDDAVNLQLLSAEDENDAFWMNNFPYSNMTISHGRNELSEEHVWAQ